jgi:hypothetical protein
MILWLFAPKEKTFSRLKYYLIAKEFDFTPHLKILFDNAPVNFPNETELTQFAMIDAILRVFPILQGNLLTPEQTLAYTFLCPYIIEIPYKIPPFQLRPIIIWIFTETAISLLREKLSQLIDKCQSVGFVNIVSEYYLPHKGYEQIIKTMAFAEDKRPLIFEFVEKYMQSTSL